MDRNSLDLTAIEVILLNHTYVTLQVVDLPRLDNIVRVWQAGPLVQVGPVVEVVHLLLAFLGKFNCQHVNRQVELGLGLVEVLLIDVVAGDLCCMSSQQNQRVIIDTEGADVMTTLLAVTGLVFVLES